MKFAVVIFALVAAASAQFSNGQYNPFNRRYNAFPTPAPYRYRPFVTSTVAPFVTAGPTRAPVVVARVATNDNQAETVKYGNEDAPDGSYNYFFETSNGIAAQAQGTPRDFGGNPPVAPVVSQGSFSWTSPEGAPIAISYVADENGYQPTGNAIPTPPPVPALIARSLEYIARTAPRQ